MALDLDPDENPADDGIGWLAEHPGRGLFLVSVATLFLELLLIRWISTEVRIFAYLQSSILVACLLGLGMGCFASGRRPDIRMTVLPLVIISAFLSVPELRAGFTSISMILAGQGGFPAWGTGAAEMFHGMTAVAIFVVSMAMTGVMLFLVWVAFIPLGQMIGGLIERHDDTVAAYSINIFGSLVGIALFTVLSVMNSGPVVWFVVVGLLLLPLVHGLQARRGLNMAMLVVVPATVAIGVWWQSADEVIWSPYQKLALETLHHSDAATGFAFDTHRVYVNNTGYQEALDLRPKTLRQAPSIFDSALAGASQYDLPFAFKPRPAKVLIVGAGAGNDAAGAVRNGAGAVTAVEIDPRIVEIGRRLHPEAPYAKPNVTVVTTDARSFMATTLETYELVIFGLLDSHTAGTMTNARLDHYVYTVESITRAKALLKPGGVMTLTFEANKPFLVQRIRATLERVFGRPPLIFRIPRSAHGWGGVMFVSGDGDAVDGALQASPGLAARVTRLQEDYPVVAGGAVRPTTDDWPYLYLAAPRIPLLFVFLGAIMLFIFAVCGRMVGLGRVAVGWARPEWHFFFLGAAFMLLEVLMISKSVLVMGNVWTVNAVVIGGILGMILLANLIKAKWHGIPVRLAYGLLLAACLALYVFDLATLTEWPFAQKVTALAILASCPMLFSGIIFIDSFDRAPDKARALGANLFGALIGGLLQTMTFVTGLQFLLLVVAGLYLAAAGVVRGRPLD